jgi:Uma2 family endonuclease
MSSATQPITVDEFFSRAATLGRCELIDGEVRQMSPAGGLHGMVAARLHTFVHVFVMEHDLGEVFTAETGFVLDAEKHTVRAPDLAFIRKGRVAAAETPKFIPIPPDLCAEVLSPGDRADAVDQKVKAWFRFGARVVCVVDPQRRQITAHTPGAPAHVIRENDALTASEVLPGFELPIRKLFA